MANILHVCGTFDPAGDVFRCVEELKKVSVHKHSLVVRLPHPFKDSMKLPSPEAFFLEYPEHLVDAADAVICHFSDWPEDWPWPKKPMAFRNLNIRYEALIDKFWSEAQFNTTHPWKYSLISASHVGAHDFLTASDFKWLPDLLPIFSKEYAPRYVERGNCVSYIKHAEELDRADFGICTKQNLSYKPHAEIMRQRKFHARVVVDNWSDGHWGLAGHESISLGLPTVAFLHHKTLTALSDFCGGDVTAFVPFIQVSNMNEAVAAAREVLSWSDECYLKARLIIRSWAERHFSSGRLVGAFWDPFVEALLNEG